MHRSSGRDKAWALGENFAHLSENGDVLPVPVGADFWSNEIDRLPAGRLVSIFDMSGNWDHWEMHPKGDEWIYLLSGALTLILQQPAGDLRQEVTAGQFAIIPRGIWHTADVRKAGKAIFITLGDETDHRPRG